MRQIVYLPPVHNKRIEPPTGKIRSSRAQELAHEIKNCMSMLFLALATLEPDGDQWKLSACTREALEEIVLEVNAIINEMVELAKERTAKSKPHQFTGEKTRDERQNAETIVDA